MPEPCDTGRQAGCMACNLAEEGMYAVDGSP
jgi:hypothetical protein